MVLRGEARFGMDKKVVLLLLFVCIIPFVGYFLNPNLAYYDSYAFFGGSCGLNQSFIIPFVPCSVIAVKVVLLVSYTASIFSIAFFGEKVFGRDGWRVGFYSATLSPLLFQEFMKFENDFVGMTLVFVAFGLFGLYRASKSRLNKASALILLSVCCFFACFAWIGSFFGAFLIGLLLFGGIVFAVTPFLVYFKYLSMETFRWSFGNQLVAEEVIGSGIVPVMFLFWVIFDKPKKLLFPLATWTAFIIGFLKINLMVFAVPLLTLNFLNLEERKGLRSKKWFPNLIVVGLVFACVYAFFGFYASPTQADLDQIQQGIVLANDLNIPLYNDWEIGWQIEYFGHKTEYKASYPNPDYNNLPRPFLALSKEELPCKKIVGTIRKTFICD